MILFSVVPRRFIPLLAVVGCACLQMQPAHSNPAGVALGAESVPAGEAAKIDQIVALHRDVQEKSDRKFSPVPRGQHPKQHGVVCAQFVIEPSLPAQFRYGIFSSSRTYEALIRFSNGRSHDDSKPDSHGMAIKLLGVGGEKVLATGKDAKTQDFIMIDNPVFFVKNVQDYVSLIQNFHAVATGNVLSKSLAGIEILFSPNYKYRMLSEAGSKRPDSPLQTRYWSTAPLQARPRSHEVFGASKPRWCAARAEVEIQRQAARGHLVTASSARGGL